MDLIDRQAAIDAIVGCTNCETADKLRAYVTKHNLDNGWTGGILDALDAVEDLPSAQPERTGHWKYAYFSGQYECSVCGHYSIDSSDYCPHCGAHMVEAEHE